MMFKLVVALALVALVSAKSLGFDNYLIKIEEDKIVITGKDGREFDIYTKYTPEIGGKQYIKLYVNGPDIEAKTLQFVDYKVEDMYFSEFLYKFFQKYEGQIDEQVFMKLLSYFERYVHNKEIYPVVFYGLQYVFFQNPYYVSEQLFNAENIFGQDFYYFHGRQVPFAKSGQYYDREFYPRDYNRYTQSGVQDYNQYYGDYHYDQQVPYSKLGYFYGRRGYEHVPEHKYFGDYYQSTPYQYGEEFYKYKAGYPKSYEYGQQSTHVGDDYYRFNHGSKYQQQYPREYTRYAGEKTFEHQYPEDYSKYGLEKTLEHQYPRDYTKYGLEKTYEHQYPKYGFEKNYEHQYPKYGFEKTYEHQYPKYGFEKTYEHQYPKYGFDKSYEQQYPRYQTKFGLEKTYKQQYPADYTRFGGEKTYDFDQYRTSQGQQYTKPFFSFSHYYY